ncbi:MAG: hypothetical protein IJQ42_11220 [Oscillospiraceae bacterium]|nr:hypothetical protein [Oscillospiraceae bacterium]
MDTAEKKPLLPSWAVKAMIWCGPTLFFLLVDTAIFGLVPEKETVATFCLIPLFGLMVTRLIFLFRSRRSVGAKIALAVLWLLLQALLWIFALLFPINLYHHIRSDAPERFENQFSKLYFLSTTPQDTPKRLLFPLELGTPEALEYHSYDESVLSVFHSSSCTLLCRYGEEEYGAAKTALETRYRFRTELMDTEYASGNKQVKQIEPFVRIGDDFFRVLLPRDEESGIYDSFYKNCILIVTNDVRREIGYIAFSDFDLDVAEDLAEFLNNYCGWKHIRR